MQYIQQNGCTRLPVAASDWLLIAVRMSDLQLGKAVLANQCFVYCAARRRPGAECGAKCAGV